MYLVGAIHDGCLVKRRREKKYEIQFYQKCKEWLENSVLPRIERVINKKPKIKGPRKGVYYIKFSCKNLYVVIEKFLNNPYEILNLDNNSQIAFVRGFFDAEGYVPNSWKKRKKYQIGFSQSGEKIPEVLEVVRIILERLGIKCGKYSIKPPKNFGKLKEYSFLVCGKDDVKRFFEIVRPEHPFKSFNLRKLLSDR